MNTTENKKLLLIGGGGHCKSVIDSVLSSGEYDAVGIIDNTAETPYQGIEVIGNDNDLPSLLKAGWEYAFITVGSVGNTGIRQRLYNMVRSLGFKVPVIADPTSVLAGDTSIGEGTFIGKNAVVNSYAATGICAIINTGAIIEHECSIGDFSHISSGAVLCGQVNIGNDTHIGAGTVVRQQIHIGNNVMIGAGSAVVKDIQDGAKAYGNPCKVVDR